MDLTMSAPKLQVLAGNMIGKNESLPQSMYSRTPQATPSYSPACPRRNAAMALNEIGTKLFAAGQHDDALFIYDSAVQSLTTVVLEDGDTTTLTPQAAQQRIAWGQEKLQACTTDSLFQEHPIDTYQEGECDVGPRPFRQPIHTELAVSSKMDSICLEAILMFNRALVHHSMSRLDKATATYSLAIYLLSSVPIPSIHPQDSTLCQTANVGMLVHNNLGQIKYVQGHEECAFSHFLAALGWAKQTTALYDNKEYRLEVANVMSNCCRTHWMAMNTSDDAHRAFAQVLRLRSSVLEWNHLDVASAHYNMGIMEFVRGGYEHSRYHLEQYVKINADRRKRGQKEIDVIPALSYILLIKNDKSTDEQSMELVQCLRLLLDKREEFGAVHSEVATILNYIGALLFQLRELDFAIEFYQEELRVEQNLLGSNAFNNEPLSLAVTLNNIGRILQERGKYDQAIGYYKRALKTECRANKYGAELVAAMAAGRVDSFVPQTKDEMGCSSTANLFATIWYNLGLMHDLKDSPKEAIRSFQMSLGLRRALLGPNHADVACLWYNIGTLQMENNMLTQASESLSESLRIRRMGVHCQQNDGHIITTLQKLATLHQNRGNVNSAIEAYSQVLEIQRTSDSSKSMDAAVTLRAISELQHASGDVDGALDTADQSLHAFFSCEVLHNSDDPDYFACAEHVGTVLLSVGSLYHERCDPVQAAAAYRQAGSIVELACQSVKPGSGPPATLLPLLELSRMLASSHCAPEA